MAESAVADTLSVARSLVARGWSVIPIKPGKKTPSVRSWKAFQQRVPTEEEMQSWWGNGRAHGIGLVTGGRSAVVIDFDGADAAEKVKAKGLPLAKTVAQRTGGGGFQLFYVHPHPDTPVPNHTDLLRTKSAEGWAIDVRGDGGYVCIPPSLHPSGRTYAWFEGFSPDEAELAPLPDEWRKLLDAAPPPAPEKTKAKSAKGQQGKRRRRLSRPDSDPAREELIERLKDLMGRDLLAFLGELGVSVTGASSHNGGEYLAHCPLPTHNDQNPSWSINKETGLWRCFGCGKSGDILALYMQVRDIGFSDAISELSTLYASELTKSGDSQEPTTKFLAGSIVSIRIDHETQNPTKQKQVRELLLYSYNQRGKFLHTKQHEAFFFETRDHRLLPLAEASFQSRFTLESGLALAESFGNQTFEYLTAHALVHGEEVEPRRLAWWDRDRQALYLDCFDGTMLVLDGQEIRIANNGDGCLFLSRPEWVPWQFVETTEQDKADFHRLILSANFDPESVLAAEEAEAVLYAWNGSLYFGSIIPTRPICVAVGIAGSGKSTRARLLVRFTYGGSADVTPINRDREDAFDAMITGQPLAVFDNVDATIPWLNDKLAVLATGGEISRRALYTTNALVKYRADCFTLLTARTPRFRRDDVAERLLILKLAQLPAKLPEDLMLSEVKQKRSQLWSVWARELNAIVKIVREGLPEESLDFRLADWGRLFLVVLRHLHPDWPAERGKEILVKITSLQQSFLVEDDTLLGLLLEWLNEPGAERWGREFAATEIFSELSFAAADRHMELPVKNPSWLGRKIMESSVALEAQMGVKVVARKDAVGRRLTFLRQEAMTA